MRREKIILINYTVYGKKKLQRFSDWTPEWALSRWCLKRTIKEIGKSLGGSTGLILARIDSLG